MIQPCARCDRPVAHGFREMCPICRKIYHEECVNGHDCRKMTTEEEKEVWP
jgi:hypothetical protein